MIDSRTQLPASGRARPAYPHRKCLAAVMALAVIILALLPAAACSSPATSPVDSTGEPRIAFNTYYINLGQARPGQEVYAEFKFHNAGDATLVISEVATESLVEGC